MSGPENPCLLISLECQYTEDAPWTSAQPPEITEGRKNLILLDWLMVFAYVDNHSDNSQVQISDGEPTLSRVIELCCQLESACISTPGPANTSFAPYSSIV